jgi:hypothetical protein
MPTAANKKPTIISKRWGRRRASDQAADPEDDQAEDKAPLSTPDVGQLAARDHQRRHHQREQRDRGLHAGCVGASAGLVRQG